MTSAKLTSQNMALWSCTEWVMGTCTRHNVWSEPSNLSGLLSWTEAKSKSGLLSSAELRYCPQTAVQPALCLSVEQTLPFSLYVMSCCHARPSSMLSPFAILSPYIFLWHHPPPHSTCVSSSLLACGSGARSCLTITFIGNEKILQSQKVPNPYGSTSDLFQVT